MTRITYFISDLHLSPEREDITDCFERFITEQAPKAEALYVLGDLFEVWIGDDDRSDYNQKIAELFKTLSQTIPIYFIRGNRDFLLGRRFCKMSGMKLLKEQAVVNLYNTPTLLLHGDELCTLDQKYQRFRRIVRHPLVKMVLKSLPLSYRRDLAKRARQKSAVSQQAKNVAMMDVVNDEVISRLAQSKVSRMIHGHTHQPNIHSLKVGKKDAQRIVLGDWYDQGSILEVTPDAINLKSLKHTI